MNRNQHRARAAEFVSRNACRKARPERCCSAGGGRGVRLHVKHPEYLDADSSDRSIGADVSVRDEPDEEEEEEDNGHDDDDDDEEDDDGYSE